MESRQLILERILKHMPFSSDQAVIEDSDLSELGVTSLHLITLIMGIQSEYGLKTDLLAEEGMPNTLGELVSLIENGIQTAGRTSD